MHGGSFVCLPQEDGRNHIDSLLKSRYTAKDLGTLGFEDSNAKCLLSLNRVFGSRDRSQTGQFLNIEPELNAKIKTVSTP